MRKKNTNMEKIIICFETKLKRKVLMWVSREQIGIQDNHKVGGHSSVNNVMQWGVGGCQLSRGKSVTNV